MDLWLSSSSGAVFSSLAEYVLNKNGIVYGVAMSEDCYSAEFIAVTDRSEALKNIGSDKCIDFSKVSFWYIRGKDDLKLKVMANKQLLSQAVPNCKYAAIFDKDFSTVDANNRFIDNEVKRRLGNGAWVHTHNGYCIESVHHILAVMTGKLLTHL